MYFKKKLQLKVMVKILKPARNNSKFGSELDSIFFFRLEHTYLLSLKPSTCKWKLGFDLGLGLLFYKTVKNVTFITNKVLKQHPTRGGGRRGREGTSAPLTYQKFPNPPSKIDILLPTSTMQDGQKFSTST